MKINLTEHRS